MGKGEGDLDLSGRTKVCVCGGEGSREWGIDGV